MDVTCSEICTIGTTSDLPTNNPPLPAGSGGGTIAGTVAITDDRELEVVTVCNAATGTWQKIVTPWLDGVAGTAVTTDLGISCSGSSNVSLELCCMVDDTLGDGSVLVPFVRVYSHEVDVANNLTSTFIGDYTDKTLSTDYTVVGTVSTPESVGSVPEVKQGTATVTGSSWSPSALVQSYTVRVASGVGGTFTDSFGNLRNLSANEVFTYAHEGELFDTVPVVTADGATTIIITYTELGVV